MAIITNKFKKQTRQIALFDFIDKIRDDSKVFLIFFESINIGEEMTYTNLTNIKEEFEVTDELRLAIKDSASYANKDKTDIKTFTTGSHYYYYLGRDSVDGQGNPIIIFVNYDDNVVKNYIIEDNNNSLFWTAVYLKTNIEFLNKVDYNGLGLVYEDGEGNRELIFVDGLSNTVEQDTGLKLFTIVFEF